MTAEARFLEALSSHFVSHSHLQVILQRALSVSGDQILQTNVPCTSIKQ